jgi:hypothetical protein
MSQEINRLRDKLELYLEESRDARQEMREILRSMSFFENKIVETQKRLAILEAELLVKKEKEG